MMVCCLSKPIKIKKPKNDVLRPNSKKNSLKTIALALTLLASASCVQAKTKAEQIKELKDKSVFLAKAKQFKDALQLSEQALKLDGKDATIYFMRAHIKEQQKDPIAALKELNKAIELNPKYAEAYLLRAKAFYFLGEMDEGQNNTKQAQSDLEMALKLNPRMAGALDYKGGGLDR